MRHHHQMKNTKIGTREIKYMISRNEDHQRIQIIDCQEFGQDKELTDEEEQAILRKLYRRHV